MVNFLYWNLNRKSLEKLVADLVKIHDIDVQLKQKKTTIPDVRRFNVVCHT